MRVNLTIEMLSDFHLGSGFGLAKSIDDRFVKDENGQPYLPGSTVKAIIRDAVERLLALEPLLGVEICSGKLRETSKIGLGKKGRDLEYLCGVRPLQVETNPSKFKPIDWRCPMCRVFGTPYTPGSFAFGSAFLPAKDDQNNTYLQSRLSKKTKSTDAFVRASTPTSLVTTYNRIDRLTGRAEDEKLFSFELAANKTIFEASITELHFPGDSQARLQNWLLLAAGCAYVEELGKRRRRGLGRCHFQFDITSQLKTSLGLSQQENLLDKLEVLTEKIEETSYAPLNLTPNDQTYAKRYVVVARTEEPIIIAQRVEAGNNIATLRYLSGTSLRGALANAFLRRHGTHNLEGLQGTLAATEFAAIFGSENIGFSNLLPAHFDPTTGDVLPAIVAPRSTFTCKLHSGTYKEYPPKPNEAHGVTDFLNREVGEKCNVCSSRLESFSGFLRADNGEWLDAQQVEPATEVSMHNALNDRLARTEENNLFSYEVLKRGQYFAGVVEDIGSGNDLTKLLTGLNLNIAEPLLLRLGRATRRGQGEVSLRFIPIEYNPENELPALLVETPLVKRFPLQGSDILTLYLASDCILQDDYLNYCGYISTHLLEARLGLLPGTLEETTDGLPGRFCSTRVVEGWNAAHGLPRETDLAIEVGSVFRYKLMRNDNETRAQLQVALKRLESIGLGQRRDEGFGWVVFNHPIHQKLEQLDIK